jgi:nitrogen fixation protein FixH
MNSNNKEELKQYKIPRIILYIFIAFFSIFLAVDIFYIYLAKTTWRGIYTENSYQKGLKYNQTLEYVKLQKLLGWSFKIKFTNLDERLSEIDVCLFDKNKKLLKNAKLIAKITRPTQEGYDFQQDLNLKNSCYFARIKFPLKGQWNVEIIASNENGTLQEVKRYVIK